MIKAVVFDFDGLMMDTETFEYYSFRELLKDYGVDLPLALYCTRIGGDADTFDPYRYLQEQTGVQHDRELLRKLRRDKFDVLFGNEGTRPGVREYLDCAREMGLRIGLASSAPKDWIFPFLEKWNLKTYFDCIRTHEDAQNVKPDPELYIQVLAEFQVRPEEAVAFEDSPNGALAAIRAGMKCVVVPNEVTSGLEASAGVHLTLNSMLDMDLHCVIERVGARQAQ